jgi:molecular chaperone DnaK
VHEKARAEMLVADARQAVKEEAPLERLRALIAELQGVYHGLGVTQATPPGPSGNGGGRPGSGDDDVIDAEFTTG